MDGFEAPELLAAAVAAVIFMAMGWGARAGMLQRQMALLEAAREVDAVLTHPNVGLTRAPPARGRAEVRFVGGSQDGPLVATVTAGTVRFDLGLPPGAQLDGRVADGREAELREHFGGLARDVSLSRSARGLTVTVARGRFGPRDWVELLALSGRWRRAGLRFPTAAGVAVPEGVGELEFVAAEAPEGRLSAAAGQGALGAPAPEGEVDG